MRNIQSSFGLFLLIVVSFLLPSQVAGSPSYKHEMLWLLLDLEAKAITDGCLSDDVASARRAIQGDRRAYLLDEAELHREGTTLVLESHVGSSGWCGPMSSHTYTRSIEIDPNLPSCPVGITD